MDRTTTLVPPGLSHKVNLVSGSNSGRELCATALILRCESVKLVIVIASGVLVLQPHHVESLVLLIRSNVLRGRRSLRSDVVTKRGGLLC